MVNERVIGDRLPMRMPLVDVASTLPGSSSFCECYIDWGKMHDLRVERYILLSGQTELSSLGCNISDSPDELLQRGKVKGAGYIGDFASKTGKLEHENQFHFIN